MLEQMLLPNMDKYKKEKRPQKHIYGTHTLLYFSFLFNVNLA